MTVWRKQIDLRLTLLWHHIRNCQLMSHQWSNIRFNEIEVHSPIARQIFLWQSICNHCMHSALHNGSLPHWTVTIRQIMAHHELMSYMGHGRPMGWQFKTNITQSFALLHKVALCQQSGLLHWPGTSILSSNATTTHGNTSSVLSVPDQVIDSHNTLWNCAVVAMVLLANLQELTIWLDYQTWTNVGGEGEFEADHLTP